MPNTRLKKLISNFASSGIDAMFVSSWPNATYVSGFQGTESWLFITPKAQYFITDSRYSEQAKKEAKGFEVLLRDKKTVSQIVWDLAEKEKVKKVGFEEHIVTHSFYKGLESKLGASRLVGTGELIEKLRIKKDRLEIDLLRKSADIAVKGFHYIKNNTRPGMTEREVQARLEHYTKMIGSQKPAFDIIIAAGAHSSMPHYQTNLTRVKNNDILLVDMGVVWEGYYSDLTRPIFLGRMSALHKKINQIVWDAQRAGIKKAGPGVPARDVDQACRDHINKMGYGDYFGHGTGHGVGLEIHEAPSVSGRSSTILEPGMVITVEPGVYLPGKFGVRIEDMVLITEKGNEVLTRDLDKSV